MRRNIGLVVVAVLVLDLEAPVVRPPRLAAFEHHHAGDLVAALHVRDVVALDAMRQLGQVQQLL